MNYFIDENDDVHAFDDEQIASGHPLAPMKAITQEQAKSYLNPPATQAQLNAEALAYLASTDWYAARAMEGGKPIPEEVGRARQAARDRIIPV